MQYAIAVRLTLPDPKSAALFLQDALGFQIEQKPGYGWWVENGAMVLILQAEDVANGDEEKVVLEIQCSDIEKDAGKLLQHPDIHTATEIHQQGNRIEQRLISDCGITLLLSKILNEDEMDELLKLPVALPWDENTDMQTRRILRIVPLAFRKQARRQVTERAEFLAVETGALGVQQSHAMQALVDITLDFQYESLFATMCEEGIDPTPYTPTCQD